MCGYLLEKDLHGNHTKISMGALTTLVPEVIQKKNMRMVSIYRAAEVVKRHPNVMVMLDHCGLPYETDEVNLKQWKQGKIFFAAVCIL